MNKCREVQVQFVYGWSGLLQRKVEGAVCRAMAITEILETLWGR